jgi:phosphatidylglycerophosphatase A
MLDTGASRDWRDHVAIFVATVGGAGYAPIAPGSVGSVIAAVALWLIPFSFPGLVLFLVVVTAAGVWAAHRVERLFGEKDPGMIVVDEVAGLTVALLASPRTLPVVAVAFVLFRVFDVVKPFPAGAAQQLPGGAGVVLDDLVAGLYTLGVLVALSVVAGWP